MPGGLVQSREELPGGQDPGWGFLERTALHGRPPSLSLPKAGTSVQYLLETQARDPCLGLCITVLLLGVQSLTAAAGCAAEMQKHRPTFALMNQNLYLNR